MKGEYSTHSPWVWVGPNPPKDANEAIRAKFAELAEQKRQAEIDAEVARRFALLEPLGAEDIHGDGTVVRFTKTFTNGDQTYTYVAIKAAGRWYVTGGWRGTWTELLAWLVDRGEFADWTFMVPQWAPLPLSPESSPF